MIQNYVSIALRNLRTRKGYSFINIVGLAAAIISLGTVPYPTDKAAIINPADALHHE